MRLSETFRSSTISELPVPLNSSKMTSSIFDPVSISAVAIIDREPPSSMLRAAPQQRVGHIAQVAACLDVARGAEEALRPLQSMGVDAARQHLARARHDGVVGAAEARDRVAQDDDILLLVHQALGPLA